MVGIVKNTYGQKVSSKFQRKNTVNMHLKQREALVTGSGLRHRGMKYSVKDVRLFLAFLVGKSDGTSFKITFNLELVATGETGGKENGGKVGRGCKGRRTARGRKGSKR